MNDYGYVRCNCGTTGLICEWLFNSYFHQDGFRSVSGQRIINVMSILGQMYGLGDKADEIYENYKREKS